MLAEKNGRRERGSSGLGGRYDLQRLLTDAHADQLVAEAVDQAVVNLDAVDCPAGEMPVVLASGWTPAAPARAQRTGHHPALLGRAVVAPGGLRGR